MCERSNSHNRSCALRIRSRLKGLTLTEVIIVVAILSLFVMLAQPSLFGVLQKSTFTGQANELVSAMQMAASTAAQSDRRYEVIIDLTDQSFVLRQITSPDLAEVLDEEIIVSERFGVNCRVAYVLFDDGEFANEGRAKFRAGHAGWQYGGKIVLVDDSDRPYSVVVSRLNRIVELLQGDAQLLTPKAKEDVVF